jgi:hypothetical protein
MEQPHSETLLPPDSNAGPRPDPWGRTPTRIALFVLHITMLVAAIALTPGGYAYQLGVNTGAVLVFGTPVLWLVLYAARTRKIVLVFCALALAQAGFIAFVALGFRAEEAALQQIVADLAQRRKEWEAQMGQFRMDPLFEMASGKRQLSGKELLELQMQARGAKAKAQELQSEATRWLAQAENRLAAVSRGAAHNFRRGVESRRPESDKAMKVTQDYFTEIEQLTGFLIERQRRYRVTTEGLVFDRDGDAQAFNEKLDKVARLQEQLNSFHQKAQEALRQLPAAR